MIPEADFHVLTSEAHQDLFIAGQTRDVKATSTEKFVPVIPPKVSTVASGEVEVGGDIWDTLKVTGDVPEGAYATVELHKLSDSTAQAEVLKNAKCTDATLVDHEFGRIEVTKAGTYETSKCTTSQPGTYGFIEILHDAEGKVLAKGEYGVESETVVVTPKPEQPKPEQSERKVIIHTAATNGEDQVQAASAAEESAVNVPLTLGVLAAVGSVIARRKAKNA